MKELNLKNMKIREMFERIMRLEDEVAEFQRCHMEGEEEEEEVVVEVVAASKK